MKKKVLNITKFMAMLIIAIVLYAFSSTRSAHRKLAAVQMNFENSTNLLISRSVVLKEINHFVKAKETPKKSIDNAVLLHLENKLLENKLIKEATVFLSLDDTLHIVISQKLPIARVIGTKNYYIDSAGVKMPLSHNYTERVPLVYGNFSEKELKELKILLDEIAANTLLQKQLVAIYKKGNQYEFDGRLGNQRVIFGALNNIKKKLKKLEIFYKYAWSKKRINKYKKINLKYHNQVICTKI